MSFDRTSIQANKQLLLYILFTFILTPSEERSSVLIDEGEGRISSSSKKHVVVENLSFFLISEIVFFFNLQTAGLMSVTVQVGKDNNLL